MRIQSKFIPHVPRAFQHAERHQVLRLYSLFSGLPALHPKSSQPMAIIMGIDYPSGQAMVSAE
jgi:hypothetical protein